MFDRTGLDIAQGNFSFLSPLISPSHLSLSKYIIFLQVRNIQQTKPFKKLSKFIAISSLNNEKILTGLKSVIDVIKQNVKFIA